MKLKKHKGVFIHSLFKSGSTYIWYKFRKSENTVCFYEPFHHYLLSINQDYENEFKKEFYITGLGEPISPHYLKEYESLIPENDVGLPYLKKEYLFDTYCKNQKIAGLNRYISSLIKCSDNKIPVMQFNRTALRTKWFKHNFPKFINIYLLRNPRDQFASYINAYTKRSRIFNAMDLLIVSKNTDYKVFSDLSKYIQLFKYEDSNIEKEINFYSIVSEAYNDLEKYIIFYYIWFASLVHNVKGSDLVLDMDKLSYDEEYRDLIERQFSMWGIDDVIFSDADIRKYKMKNLQSKNIDLIESQIRKKIINISKNNINNYQNKFNEDIYQKYFHFSEETEANKNIFTELDIKNSNEIYEKIIKAIYEKEELERKLKITYMQKFINCDRQYAKFKAADFVFMKLINILR